MPRITSRSETGAEEERQRENTPPCGQARGGGGGKRSAERPGGGAHCEAHPRIHTPRCARDWRSPPLCSHSVALGSHSRCTPITTHRPTLSSSLLSAVLLRHRSAASAATAAAASSTAAAASNMNHASAANANANAAETEYRVLLVEVKLMNAAHTAAADSASSTAAAAAAAAVSSLSLLPSPLHLVLRASTAATIGDIKHQLARQLESLLTELESPASSPSPEDAFELDEAALDGSAAASASAATQSRSLRFRTRHVRKKGSGASGASYILTDQTLRVGDVLRNEEEIIAEISHVALSAPNVQQQAAAAAATSSKHKPSPALPPRSATRNANAAAAASPSLRPALPSPALGPSSAAAAAPSPAVAAAPVVTLAQSGKKHLAIRSGGPPPLLQPLQQPRPPPLSLPFLRCCHLCLRRSSRPSHPSPS